MEHNTHTYAHGELSSVRLGVLHQEEGEVTPMSRRAEWLGQDVSPLQSRFDVGRFEYLSCNSVTELICSA